MKLKLAGSIYERCNELIRSSAFKDLCRLNSNQLIRTRKITVPELVTTIIRGAKRGIHTAMLDMIKAKEVKTNSYSEAAFCKARRKINYKAFKTLFESTGRWFCDDADEALRFLDIFRVWAIDGSKINLPTTPDILEEFGSEPFKTGLRAQGLASCLYDVLNHISIDAVLERFDANERTLAIQHFDVLDQYCRKNNLNPQNELITMDRGYPSEEIIKSLYDHRFSFVVRVTNNNFWREIRDLKEDDAVITRGEITVRVVRVPLKCPEITESGKIVTTATLITNLTSDMASKEEISTLYRLRWGIETNYGFLKNRLELENFTGLSALSVRQDFYAVLYLANMVAISEYDAAPKIQKKNKRTKNNYKANFTELYRQVHRELYTLVLTDSSRKREQALNRIDKEIMKTLIPVRPNRNPSRGKPASSPKFHRNHKPS